MSVDQIAVSGEHEVLLTAFRRHLYRLMLLSVESQRAFFDVAQGADSGRLPHVSF
jgi:hypothetical protein